MKNPKPAIPPKDGQQILSIRQAALLLGVSESTVWRLRANKDFPQPFQLSPKRVGWSREVLADWLAKRTTAAVPQSPAA